MGLTWRHRALLTLTSLKKRITTELAERLQAEVEIERVGLDVLPRPQLALHNVRLAFADGTVLRVALVGLSPTLKGLFVGRPEIVRIRCEKPDVRIAVRQQEADDDNFTGEARRKDPALLIESALSAIPRIGLTVHDGTVHISAPDGSVLVLEKLEAEADMALQGVRVFADCTSGLWENLAVTLSYHAPEAVLELDARDVDIAQGIHAFKAFAGAAFPDVAPPAKPERYHQFRFAHSHSPPYF